jgi:hypothetical protein
MGCGTSADHQKVVPSGNEEVSAKAKGCWCWRRCKKKSAQEESHEELPTVSATPPERTSKDVSTWTSKWYSAEPLKVAASTGDTILLDGGWLCGQADQKSTLPKRQDLPHDAAIKPQVFLKKLHVDLEKPYELSKEKGNIGAVSYCWATKPHPDPTGEQLQRLKTPLRLMQEVGWALAIFLDWCSLHQSPRDAAQDEAFKRGLKNVNLWYAHPLTWVLALTVVPAGVKAYIERGWPRFEKAVSTLIKDSYMYLDLGAIEGKDMKNFTKMREACQGAREPPVTPATFRETLKSLTFTSGSDRAFVLQKYAATFTEVMGSTARLDFDDLPWGDAEMASLEEVLPWCPCVEVMSFNGCKSITRIPTSTTRMQTLRQLDLRRCVNLTSLPQGVGNLQALKKLYVQGCSELKGARPILDKLKAQGCFVAE